MKSAVFSFIDQEDSNIIIRIFRKEFFGIRKDDRFHAAILVVVEILCQSPGILDIRIYYCDDTTHCRFAKTSKKNIKDINKSCANNILKKTPGQDF